MLRTRIIALTIVSLAILTACSEQSNGPDDGTEQEIINRVEFETLEINSVTRVTYVWEDADGPGGAGPNRIDTIKLDSSVSYVGKIRLYDTTKDPDVDVTKDIEGLKDEHQFFFTITNGILTISAGDIDGRGLPVGLSTVIAPAKRGSGELTVELSHFDDAATKDGVKRGDETDVSVVFPVVVF